VFGEFAKHGRNVNQRALVSLALIDKNKKIV
jgi:hypothetical protein